MYLAGNRMLKWLFRRKEKPEQVSLFGKNVEVTPEKVIFEHQLLVNGKVSLDIKGRGAKSQLIVSEPATVIGNVRAGTVIVAGELIGNVEAKDLVEVALKGKISGEVVCKRLEQSKEGSIGGRVTVSK